MTQLLIALFLCVCFALAGLTVDLGHARLAQQQMTAATDAAALEGMRLEDTSPETDRRLAASRTLRAHFDDDFDVTATDARQYGAGARIELEGGTTSMGANQHVVVDPANPVYEPEVELNLVNAPHGDMVAGRFDPTDLAHMEDPAYARSDFDAAAATPGWDAFLIRLRRTSGTRPEDEVAGVSSHGPSLPFLFGRGSLIDADARQRGLTVRATAIAAGRRATLVGPDDPLHGLVGASPFLLDFPFWNAMAANTTTTLVFGGDGTIPGTGGRRRVGGGPPMPNPFRPPSGPPSGPPIIPPGQIGGFDDLPRGVFANREDEERRSWSLGDPVDPVQDLTVSQALQWLGHPEDDAYQPRLFFVPVYEGVIDWDGRPGNSNPPHLPPVENRDRGEGPARIVGFGAVVVVSAVRLSHGDADPRNDGARVVVRKLPAFVAPTNASSVSTPGLASSFAAPILDLYREVDSPLRAAAIVR